VARTLVRRCQEKHSTPQRPYRLNAEQLEAVALYVHALQAGFEQREDTSQPFLHPAKVLMTNILVGGGGCGKTMLLNEVIVPLLETYYGPGGVLKQAPSNKAARGVHGTTVHSSQGLTPDSSLRTHALALNAEVKRKLQRTAEMAGPRSLTSSRSCKRSSTTPTRSAPHMRERLGTTCTVATMPCRRKGSAAWGSSRTPGPPAATSRARHHQHAQQPRGQEQRT
jgi:hypothetical protein